MVFYITKSFYKLCVSICGKFKLVSDTCANYIKIICEENLLTKNKVTKIKEFRLSNGSH